MIISEACVTECTERLVLYDNGVVALVNLQQITDWVGYDSIDNLPEVYQGRIAVLDMVPQDHYVPGVGVRLDGLAMWPSTARGDRTLPFANMDNGDTPERIYWVVPDSDPWQVREVKG